MELDIYTKWLVGKFYKIEKIPNPLIIQSFHIFNKAKYHSKVRITSDFSLYKQHYYHPNRQELLTLIVIHYFNYPHNKNDENNKSPKMLFRNCSKTGQTHTVIYVKDFPSKNDGWQPTF